MFVELMDRLGREFDILEQMCDWPEEAGPESKQEASLAVAQAKRVRAASNLLVRALAQERDNLQPGGTR